MDNGAGFPSAATGACSACSAALTSPFAAPPVTALAPSAARYQRKLTGYSSRSQVLYLWLLYATASRLSMTFFIFFSGSHFTGGRVSPAPVRRGLPFAPAKGSKTGQRGTGLSPLQTSLKLSCAGYGFRFFWGEKSKSVLRTDALQR